jgi:hypothetical protein
MRGMRAEEAERFYEEDEDPAEVFAAFDAAEKGLTASPAGDPRPLPGRSVRLRHDIAAFLRRIANLIDPSPSRIH